MKPSETKNMLEVASLNAAPKQEPQVQEFDDLASYLEQKGKELLGDHFRLFHEDYDILFRILVYLFKDQYHADLLNIDLKKGLLLTGPIGCGKHPL
ncbi:hypothetical protein [Desertivirga arenae]|uniref:hypothetical protein n=1 Tax=Desertivirga arenae TaxID=2810309 RepID=UPI001A960866|nr:hypothetical protein [Pedobacter sp. SYSU D00823]